MAEPLRSPDHKFDALTSLRSVGVPVDMLPAQARAVLTGLTEAEVAVLTALRSRLIPARDTVEVEGQGLPILL
jgi:hypothetical protein